MMGINLLNPKMTVHGKARALVVDGDSFENTYYVLEEPLRIEDVRPLGVPDYFEAEAALAVGYRPNVIVYRGNDIMSTIGFTLALREGDFGDYLMDVPVVHIDVDFIPADEKYTKDLGIRVVGGGNSLGNSSRYAGIDQAFSPWRAAETASENAYRNQLRNAAERN